MPFSKPGAAALFSLVAVISVCAAPPAQRPDPAPAHPAALLAIADDLRAIRAAPLIDGMPDFSSQATRAQTAELDRIRRRFDALVPGEWPVHDRVDYLLVRSEIDQLDYALRVQRPTSRNPNFYLSSISSAGMLSGVTLGRLGQLVSQPPPFDEARAQAILSHLRLIPRILAQAKQNLTEPAAHLAEWALATLDRPRDSSREFADALAPHFPAVLTGELRVAADAMGGALADYEQWIRARRDRMERPKPAGRAMYNWLLHHVWLLPYDADEILRMGEQEYGRFQSFTAFEESRNRDVPVEKPAATTAKYIEQTDTDERAIRAFLSKTRVLTVPAFVGPYRRAEMPRYLQAFSLWHGLSGYSTPDGGAVKYAVPESHPYAKTYWEAIMRTDPSTNIFHDGIPGHHFQGLLARHNPCPIRRQHTERFKSEGWATYWEEAAVQLGYYDQRPRSRELIYSYLRLRALRVIVDVKLALGEISRAEAIDLLESVPMDERIATEEVNDFFGAPTGGIVYLIGKLQIERLLADRKRQLGGRFDLGAFHDQLMNAAWVPLALTRWELTGAADEVTSLFNDRTPLPRPIERRTSFSGGSR